MNIDAWLSDSITVRSQASRDGDGVITYGSNRTVAARVQNGKDRGSEAIEHSSVVYTIEAILVDDEITLAGETSARRPVSVTNSHDKAGGTTLYKTLLS